MLIICTRQTMDRLPVRSERNEQEKKINSRRKIEKNLLRVTGMTTDNMCAADVQRGLQAEIRVWCVHGPSAFYELVCAFTCGSILVTDRIEVDAYLTFEFRTSTLTF